MLGGPLIVTECNWAACVGVTKKAECQGTQHMIKCSIVRTHLCRDLYKSFFFFKFGGNTWTFSNVEGLQRPGNQEPTPCARAGHFSSLPRQSQTSSWCGSEGGWAPSRLLPGAHTPYLVISAPSLGAGPEGVPRPCPQRPSHGHHRTGAELGNAGSDPLPRASTAGSGAASPGRAESRKPLSPRSPSPELPSAPTTARPDPARKTDLLRPTNP